MSKFITSTEVRLSYENLLTPRAQNEGDDPTYSTMILVPKEDKETVEGIKKAITEALNEGIAKKWGGKKPANLKHPLRDGDVERSDDPNAKGMWFFNAKGPKAGQEAAFLYAKNGRQITVADANATEVVYSGVYGRVSLNFYAYDRNGNRGVAAGLVSFLSGEHGDRLDSRPTATSALAEFGVDPLSVPEAEAGTPDSGDVWGSGGDDAGDPWGTGE